MVLAMRRGLILTLAVLFCCVNQLWAEQASKQSASIALKQLPSVTKEYLGDIPLNTGVGEAIKAISTPAGTFQPAGARKLLVSSVTTSTRHLLQVPLIRNWWSAGRNVGSADSGGNTWWHALRAGQQRNQLEQDDRTASSTLNQDGLGAPPAEIVAEQSQLVSDTEHFQQPADPVAQPTTPAAEQTVTDLAPDITSDTPAVATPAADEVSTQPATADAYVHAPAAMPAETATVPARATTAAPSSQSDQAASNTEAEAAAKAKDFDSWSTTPPCTYPRTLTNFNVDRLGRPWGFSGATKQSCPFRSTDAPIILWEEAADCPYALTDSNALPDKQGRLWGFDASTGFSCAFKSQTLPPAKYENAPTPGGYRTSAYRAFLDSVQNQGLRAALTRLLPSAAAAAAAAAAEQAVAGGTAVDTPLQQLQTGPYCIPADDRFHVLCAGDSITQGSVPSRGFNYPYAITLEELLRRKLGPRSRAYDAGLGGGGLYQVGFSINQKFPEFYRENLAYRDYDLAVIMIGINDLLRGGSSADSIMAGLQPLFDETLAKGIPIISIPPLPAPGFVAEADSKEAQRKQMAELLKAAAARRAAETGGVGPQIWVLDLQSGPMNFYRMSNEQRALWLDDGLHLTQYAYQQLGQFVYDEVMAHMCSLPALSAKDYAQIAAQEASYSKFPDAARERA